MYWVNDRVQFLIRGIYGSRAINAWKFYVTVSSSNDGNGVRCMGFEVQIAVVMKSTTCSDITPRSPLNVNRRFGETFRLHFQGRRISRTRNQHESSWQAKQAASRNFGLYRKQERNGIVELNSRSHARRAVWNRPHPLAVTRPPIEPMGDKNGSSVWPWKRAGLLV
jgi:hypothetical protein